jgi:hypothetical protein
MRATKTREAMMRVQRAAGLLVLGLLLLGAASALAQESQSVVFSYHDGVPYYHGTEGGGDYSLAGLFFFPTDYDRPFVITKVRFYHGGNYGTGPSPTSFRLVVVYREIGGSDHHFQFIYAYPRPELAPLETSCNYCWEEVEIPNWGLPILWGNTQLEGYGIFLYEATQLTDGHYAPQPWLDAAVDHPLTTCLPLINSDWDVYEAPCTELGDMLMDVEIAYLDEISTEEISFSTLLSYYR